MSATQTLSLRFMHFHFPFPQLVLYVSGAFHIFFVQLLWILMAKGGESLSRACAGVLHSPEICASQADFLP